MTTRSAPPLVGRVHTAFSYVSNGSGAGSSGRLVRCLAGAHARAVSQRPISSAAFRPECGRTISSFGLFFLFLFAFFYFFSFPPQFFFTFVPFPRAAFFSFLFLFFCFGLAFPAFFFFPAIFPPPFLSFFFPFFFSFSSFFSSPSAFSSFFSFSFFSLFCFPKLDVVLPHSGGTMPGLIGRWDHGASVRAELKHMTKPPSSYLRRFHYDTITHNDWVLTNLIEQVGADRVVMGSDCPADMSYTQPVAVVERLNDVAAKDREAILGGNAARLLRL